jgi:hypothetical protein
MAQLQLIPGVDYVEPSSVGPVAAITSGSITGVTVFTVAATAQPATRESLGVHSRTWPWIKDSTIGYCPAGGAAGAYAQGNGVLIAYHQRLPTTNLNSSILIVTAAGSAGSVFRTGLLTPASDNRPGVLVRDNGTVAADSTGAKTITFGAALSVTNRTYYGVCLKDGAAGSATISAGLFQHSEGELGAIYVAGTPQVFPISWWYLGSQTGALAEDYSSSAWIANAVTATPRILYFP